MSMQINARVTTRPIDLFIDYLDSFNDIVAKEGREVYELYKPIILERLQRVPPPFKGKRRWTSVKQQKAFFASNGFGGGIPTQRTNAIVDAYDVIDMSTPGEFRIMIVNTNPATKFLKGGMSLRSKPYQQQMHKDTGWENQAEVVTYYLESMQTEFIDRIKQNLSDFGIVTGSSRRAYTGR